MGVSLGIVLGGGNHFRGSELQEIDTTSADQIGMLGTVINSLYLKNTLERHCMRAVVFSSIVSLPGIYPLRYDEMNQAFENGFVVIFAGGTSNPLFTTDTAAALRAVEMNANLLVKATKVEGVFSKDPVLDPKAKMYRRISYNEAIRLNLSVMDIEAFSLCRRYRIPIQVVNFFKEDNLLKTVLEEHVGTLIQPDTEK
jgi:uridylate kinase